ncbi:AGE family epimerase/isomerase [Streptomyces hoynatensis]|uniref:N-acyl-D-glucosamine 2-epimerase n=1 Tax=Streptomyces hoynatensis TaxID=1141874 RepID=A0A3A9YNS2_9ACTN|nr:AGE family epimerase/isomerase [Streptomyces hoynatensis]RKN36696.1 N-acyl-D-glucosamine 2-epimerase [Streptomyces hoynatensis]
MAEIDFSFSDTVAGYVLGREGREVALRTVDGRPVTVHLTDTTSGQMLRNLGAPYEDVTARLYDVLLPGVLVFSYGPVYPEPEGLRFQAGHLTVVGTPKEPFPFEQGGWWTRQLHQLARFYRRSQFAEGPVDFADYRTRIRGSGEKTGQRLQETDTISRLVYGMASAYMLTGDADLAEVAEQGAQYLHDHMRFTDTEHDVVYWYHGIDQAGGRERKLFASEFGDDYRAIPAYEQIYALVGLTQTYRVTGAPYLRQDIEATVRLFERFFADDRLGGYFSHIDPVTLSPLHDSLGRNRYRKNWNSIGDHAPAYLFNLYLATGEDRYLKMLEHTFDMIVTHMPEPEPAASPFVRERFHGDWTPDPSWGWQQDRAVVGHNLKIAWNLMRMHTARPKPEYRALAERLGRTLPAVGRDAQRGGWYDLVQRVARNGRHDFVWHDRKTWWQQEQAVLAYLILAGRTGQEEFLREARESAAFYNAFFLDHDEGGVYFTVLAQGLPYLVGEERLKGSHAMSFYHKAELCFLAETYTRLLVHGEPLDLWFRPRPDAHYPGGLLRAAPDLLPAGRVLLESVWVDGAPYQDFDARNLTVRLPRSDGRLTVRARLRPVREPRP